MKRRDTLKTLSLSSFGLAAVPTSELVGTPPAKVVISPARVENERQKDVDLHAKQFLTLAEKTTLNQLADIIIPADGKYPAASKVGVVDFIEFMCKDKPELQTPLRGGMMWLNRTAKARFGQIFSNLNYKSQIEIVEDIAYTDAIKPGMSQGVAFFSQVRDLVVTGYYTTKIGFENIGYVGNTPNDWPGVPDDVLAKYNLKYD